MGEDQGQERTQLADDQDKSAAELRAEIEGVREDLGDTAAALAAKTDVKTRARERADEIKRNATAKKDDLKAKVGAGPSAAGGSAQPGGVSERASSALAQVRTRARENPVPTAALGALLGGFLLGRITGRDD